jgi:hypothetical protein
MTTKVSKRVIRALLDEMLGQHGKVRVLFDPNEAGVEVPPEMRKTPAIDIELGSSRLDDDALSTASMHVVWIPWHAMVGFFAPDDTGFAFETNDVRRVPSAAFHSAETPVQGFPAHQHPVHADGRRASFRVVKGGLA